MIPYIIARKPEKIGGPLPGLVVALPVSLLIWGVLLAVAVHTI